MHASTNKRSTGFAFSGNIAPIKSEALVVGWCPATEDKSVKRSQTVTSMRRNLGLFGWGTYWGLPLAAPLEVKAAVTRVRIHNTCLGGEHH